MPNRFMKSIVFFLLLGSILSSSAATVCAGQNKNKVVIAALIYGNTTLNALNGFKTGMTERGYIEGENIEYIFDGPYKTIAELDGGMEKLMRHNPDIIFSATTPATLAAKKATSHNMVPVVFGPVNNPVKAGIVSEQKHPGGNITGVMLANSIAKELEWALRISPQIQTILLPYNPNDKSSMITFQAIKEAVATFKLKCIARVVTSDEDINALLADCPKGVDVIFLPRDAMIMSRVEDFAKVANQKKLILSGTRLEMAERGALFSFGFSDFELGRQMSRLADLILHGKKPGELPVETAEDYLSINLKTANAIGLTIDDRILRKAQVIIRPD